MNPVETEPRHSSRRLRAAAWPSLAAAVFSACCLLSLGCSDRLTPARAATILRHSKAFLSGAVESQPVFDGVTSLVPGPGGRPTDRDEADAYVAEFSYHWRTSASEAGRTAPSLTSRAAFRRAGNGWAVDDDRSRTLTPSWPRLPKTPDLLSPGGVRSFP